MVVKGKVTTCMALLSSEAKGGWICSTEWFVGIRSLLVNSVTSIRTISQSIAGSRITCNFITGADGYRV